MLSIHVSFHLNVISFRHIEFIYKYIDIVVNSSIMNYPKLHYLCQPVILE